MVLLLAFLTIVGVARAARWLRRNAFARPVAGTIPPHLAPLFLAGPAVDADQVEIAAQDLRAFHADVAAFLAEHSLQR